MIVQLRPLSTYLYKLDGHLSMVLTLNSDFKDPAGQLYCFPESNHDMLYPTGHVWLGLLRD